MEFGSEVRQLSNASTSGGSGGETWVFVSAPLGWAKNIACQFVNERDYGGQTISYKPDFNPCKNRMECLSDNPLKGEKDLASQLAEFNKTFDR